MSREPEENMRRYAYRMKKAFILLLCSTAEADVAGLNIDILNVSMAQDRKYLGHIEEVTGTTLAKSAFTNKARYV